MKETKRINKVNRFQCDYKKGNCRRILNREGTKSFPCTMCGHGTMRLVKPRAYCELCEKPVYGNVDLRPDSISKEGYLLICGNCTMGKVDHIAGLEKQLNTEFIDTDDMKEKLAYYEAKKEEAGEQDVSITKIRVKSLGGRLNGVRKKLSLTQTQLAEYFGMESKSTVLRYEKNTRKIPEDIREWITTSESIFKHLGKEKGKERITRNLVAIKKDLKKAVNLQNGEYPLRESSQF